MEFPPYAEHKKAYWITGGVAVVLLFLWWRKRNATVAADNSADTYSAPAYSGGLDLAPLSSYPISSGYGSGSSSGTDGGLGVTIPSLTDSGSGTDSLAVLLGNMLNNGGSVPKPITTTKDPATSGSGTTAGNAGTTSTDDKTAIYNQLFKQGVTTANTTDVMEAGRALGWSFNRIGAAFGLSSSATQNWLENNNSTGQASTISNAPTTPVSSTVVQPTTVTAPPDFRSKVYASIQAHGFTDADINNNSTTHALDIVAHDSGVLPSEIGMALFGMSSNEAAQWYMVH